jgi:hypothetical protein
MQVITILYNSTNHFDGAVAVEDEDPEGAVVTMRNVISSTYRKAKARAVSAAKEKQRAEKKLKEADAKAKRRRALRAAVAPPSSQLQTQTQANVDEPHQFEVLPQEALPCQASPQSCTTSDVFPQTGLLQDPPQQDRSPEFVLDNGMDEEGVVWDIPSYLSTHPPAFRKRVQNSWPEGADNEDVLNAMVCPQPCIGTP